MYVCSLIIQHAKSVHRVVLSSVVCLVFPDFFPQYLIDGMIFEKFI